MKTDRKTTAFVFAAGLGTRLYPLTADKPKALVEYRGKTLLEHVIGKITASGISRIVVNIHHFADMMVDFIQHHDFDAEIIISDERDYLRDTGGGLKFAAPLLAECDEVLMHNVDILSDLDLNALIKQHIQNEALATLAVRERTTSRYFLFDSSMNLCGWRNLKTGEEKISLPAGQMTPYAFSGIHIVKRKLIDLIPSDEKKSIVPIYIELARKNKLKGYLHNEGTWRDMGKFEDFK